VVGVVGGRRGGGGGGGGHPAIEGLSSVDDEATEK